MRCPHCKKEIDDAVFRRHIRSESARLAGQATSKAKAKAARINGLRGGRPRKEKTG